MKTKFKVESNGGRHPEDAHREPLCYLAVMEGWLDHKTTRLVGQVPNRRETLGSHGSISRWVQIAPEKIVKDFSPTGEALLFMLADNPMLCAA